MRDVLWYKPTVAGFLKECGVPTAIMAEVSGLQKSNTPTIKIAHHVMDRLDTYGDPGAVAAKNMLTRLYYWNDLHSISAERKDAALRSLDELRKAYDRYKAQQEFQAGREKQMHAERTSRGSLSQLDHQLLQVFRDQFDEIFSMKDRQARGNRFQDLMNDVFAYYGEKSLGPFNRTGEQIDGTFYFDKHWYYVEIRWKEKKASAGDISVLRDRAQAAYGGDTKALFISFNGFSQDCLDSLAARTDERVILMDGMDLRCILDCSIAFDVLLAEKQAEMIRNKRPFVSAKEIILRRNT